MRFNVREKVREGERKNTLFRSLLIRDLHSRIRKSRSSDRGVAVVAVK